MVHKTHNHRRIRKHGALKTNDILPPRYKQPNLYKVNIILNLPRGFIFMRS